MHKINTTVRGGKLGEIELKWKTLLERERGDVNLLDTHPKLTNKYVLTRMQATGKNGTKGQTKPGKKDKKKSVNDYCMHIEHHF